MTLASFKESNFFWWSLQTVIVESYIHIMRLYRKEIEVMLQRVNQYLYFL